jgi:minor curlin subunit
MVGLALQMSVFACAFAQDISNISSQFDFGKPDIVRNEGLLVQIGSYNSAFVSQFNTSGGTLGQYVDVRQIGTENQALIEQSGDLNRARLNQNGSGNYANIVQSGFENSLDVTQLGYGNAIYALQAGSSNNIDLAQPGFASANIVEIGDRNTVSVVQAIGSKITIRLEGSGMTATVRQN